MASRSGNALDSARPASGSSLRYSRSGGPQPHSPSVDRLSEARKSDHRVATEQTMGGAAGPYRGLAPIDASTGELRLPDAVQHSKRRGFQCLARRRELARPTRGLRQHAQDTFGWRRAHAYRKDAMAARTCGRDHLVGLPDFAVGDEQHVTALVLPARGKAEDCRERVLHLGAAKVRLNGVDHRPHMPQRLGFAG